LQGFGISASAYAGYMSVIWTIHAVFCLIVSLLLFFRRSDDRNAILTSFTLLVFAVYFICDR
jgi:hypothetical protein